MSSSIVTKFSHVDLRQQKFKTHDGDLKLHVYERVLQLTELHISVPVIYRETQSATSLCVYKRNLHTSVMHINLFNCTPFLACKHVVYKIYPVED